MPLAANPSIESALERLTDPQKWDLFQALWDDLSAVVNDETHSPDWRENVLRERLESEERGETVWRSVDETFDRIRSELNRR